MKEKKPILDKYQDSLSDPDYEYSSGKGIAFWIGIIAFLLILFLLSVLLRAVV